MPKIYSFTSLKQRYKKIAGGIFLMVLLIVGQAFLWDFVRSQANKLQQARSQEEQISNVDTKNKTIATTIAQQRDQLVQLDVVAPPLSSLTQIVVRLEQLADQRGLTATITGIQENFQREKLVPAKIDEIIPITISVTVSGPVDIVLDYLDQIEHIQEMSLVTSWKLTQDSVTVTEGATPTPASFQRAPHYSLSASVVFFLQQNDSPDEQ